MWCETVNSFLANHGILMEMFLHDMVLTCALIAFVGGVALGWLITGTKGGKVWEYTPWPKTKM